MWPAGNDNFKKIGFLLNCVLLFIGCSPSVEHREKKDNLPWVELRQVLSGDTIQLKDGRIIKYLGVQSPQEGEFFFEKCRDANAWLLRANKLILQYDDEHKKDAQGRELAYVFAPSLGLFCFVNKELILYGYAKAENSSKCKYKKEFLEMEKNAREKKAGIWHFQSVHTP
jgi:endonuclease YncB( thermonuclease family)